MRDRLTSSLERRLIGKQTPAPVRSLSDLETQLGSGTPVLAVLRGTSELLRDHWPWLVPLLLWVGLGTYRRERNAIRARRG